MVSAAKQTDGSWFTSLQVSAAKQNRGGTYTAAGLDACRLILEKADKRAPRVVLLTTDGKPNL